jgi:hypothetical protein
MKQCLIIGNGGAGQWYKTYLWTDIANELNGLLEVSSMDSFSNPNTLSNIFIRRLFDVGFLRELLGGRGIALVDQVVHNEIVDITEG